LIALTLTLAALVAFGMRDVFALATIGAGSLVLFVTAREFAIGARGVRRADGRNWLSATTSLFERDQHRYGGYLVHIGVALIAISALSSYAFQQQVRTVVAAGDTFEVGGHTIAFHGLLERDPGVNGISSEVVAQITVDGDTVLNPGQRFFTNFAGQPVAIVAIDGNPLRDVYVFMQGWDENGAEIQVFVNPLMQLLWFGGFVYIVGGVLAYAPARGPVTERPTVPPEEAQRA